MDTRVDTLPRNALGPPSSRVGAPATTSPATALDNIRRITHATGRSNRTASADNASYNSAGNRTATCVSNTRDMQAILPEPHRNVKQPDGMPTNTTHRHPPTHEKPR